MIRRADRLKLIPAEAYGSHPGHRANICALNKVLSADQLRQKQQSGILCSNDTASCYDRIVHLVASLYMQRLGVSADKGYGLRAISAMSREPLYYVCYTFVDDTDTIYSPFGAHSVSDLIAGMQKALDLWNGGLQAMGGQLAMDKNYWYLIGSHTSQQE